MRQEDQVRCRVESLNSDRCVPAAALSIWGPAPLPGHPLLAPANEGETTPPCLLLMRLRSNEICVRNTEAQESLVSQCRPRPDGDATAGACGQGAADHGGEPPVGGGGRSWRHKPFRGQLCLTMRCRDGLPYCQVSAGRCSTHTAQPWAGPSTWPLSPPRWGRRGSHKALGAVGGLRPAQQRGRDTDVDQVCPRPRQRTPQGVEGVDPHAFYPMARPCPPDPRWGDQTVPHPSVLLRRVTHREWRIRSRQDGPLVAPESQADQEVRPSGPTEALSPGEAGRLHPGCPAQAAIPTARKAARL